jgi:hypothetical protein
MLVDKCNLRLTLDERRNTGVGSTHNLYGGRGVFIFVKRILCEIAAGWNTKAPLMGLCRRVSYLDLIMIAAALVLTMVASVLELSLSKKNLSITASTLKLLENMPCTQATVREGPCYVL